MSCIIISAVIDLHTCMQRLQSEQTKFLHAQVQVSSNIQNIYAYIIIYIHIQTYIHTHLHNNRVSIPIALSVTKSLVLHYQITTAQLYPIPQYASVYSLYTSHVLYCRRFKRHTIVYQGYSLQAKQHSPITGSNNNKISEKIQCSFSVPQQSHLDFINFLPTKYICCPFTAHYTSTQ